MRILYVAKHNSGYNDDEGAITHALQSLGHTVEKVSERNGSLALNVDADFLLFHGWTDIHTLKKIAIPKVFWYFDLIEYGDVSLGDLCKHRTEQVRAVTDLSQLGFCTDGDWVAKDTTGKLVKLTQGADSRIIGVAKRPKTIDILFTGNNKWGVGRKEFVSHMTEKYGGRFVHIRRGCFRESLKNTIARAKVVVCPWSPITPNYWSNRVYVAAGFGACVIHPYVERLAEQYADVHEVAYYRSEKDLHYLIEFYMSETQRDRTKYNALTRTIREHTYTHRCRTLIDTVKERLF